jgi:hypothetical protein
MQHPQQPAWPQAQAYPPPPPAYPVHAHAAAAYPQPAYPPPGHAPHAAVPHAAYEFGPDHNRVIERTAGRVQAFGIVSIVLGALQTIGGVLMLMQSIRGVGTIVAGIVAIVVGVIFTRGAKRLRDVVKTAGDDIAHLMGALDEVGKAFMIQLVMVAVAFVAGFLFAAV